MKRKIDTTRYPVRLRRLSRGEGGGWLAEAPDLPGCMSDGSTPAEAVEHVQGAIRSWIEAAAELGRAVPPPMADESYSGQWRIRMAHSLHRRLAERAKAEGVSLNALTTTILAEALGRRDQAAE